MKPFPIFLLISALSCATDSAFAQGSITPPGTPGPTMKTLDQVEARTLIPAGVVPVTISASGSYYLGGNINISSASNGIIISASNVTIDLNGFTLAGVGAPSLAGIFLNGGVTKVTIRNGTIKSWGSRGINAIGNAKVRVENLRVTNNGSTGMSLDVNARVLNCIAEANGSDAIVATDNAVIEDCQAISSTAGAGIAAGNGAVISRCSASSSATNGIAAADFANISDCTTSGNSGDGIHVSGQGSAVTRCTSGGNSGDGIELSSRGSVRDCNVNLNGADGIHVVNQCLVIGNNSQVNAGAGVRAEGSDNRIEGNYSTFCHRGIELTSFPNVTVRNFVQGSTDAGVAPAPNYVIHAGNVTGTIVTTETALNSAANSNANFSFVN